MVVHCVCRTSAKDKKQCPVTFTECKHIYNQPGRHISNGSFKSGFGSAHCSMKKKLLDWQKQWKARCAHILKAPFHVPDSPPDSEEGVYVIGQRVEFKDLHEMVVALKFDEKQNWNSTVL